MEKTYLDPAVIIEAARGRDLQARVIVVEPGERYVLARGEPQL
jgi:hypothetical protein